MAFPVATVMFNSLCVCVCSQGKKKVACRHDWHQTGNNVVVTIYAKNAVPDKSCIEANRTVVSVDIFYCTTSSIHSRAGMGKPWPGDHYAAR